MTPTNIEAVSQSSLISEEKARKDGGFVTVILRIDQDSCCVGSVLEGKRKGLRR